MFLNQARDTFSCQNGSTVHVLATLLLPLETLALIDKLRSLFSVPANYGLEGCSQGCSLPLTREAEKCSQHLEGVLGQKACRDCFHCLLTGLERECAKLF
jgi:hypothetical protein